MVKEVIKENTKYFMCEECLMYYKTRELAQKCEDFCRENHACSIEITKHAVELKWKEVGKMSEKHKYKCTECGCGFEGTKTKKELKCTECECKINSNKCECCK